MDDVYGGGAAEGMADASEFPVDDEDIPDTGECTKIFHSTVYRELCSP